MDKIVSPAARLDFKRMLLGQKLEREKKEKRIKPLSTQSHLSLVFIYIYHYTIHLTMHILGHFLF